MTQSRAELLRLTALASTLTICVCLISWPGFMSYDSMYALRQARTGIETGGYPPMVSYVWAVCERVVPGQGGMFIFQNALVFLSVLALGRAIGAGELQIALSLVLLTLAPLTLGPMLVVWKDVSFAGFMALGYAFTLRYCERRRGTALALALAFVILASSFRLNGIAAAIPALAVIAWTICGVRTPWSEPGSDRDGNGSAWPGRLTALTVLTGLTVLVFGFVVLASSWRLPDFKRIEIATGSGWTQVGDLIGISVCTGRNLLPPSLYDGAMTGARLERIYRPEHGQLSVGPPPLLLESGIVGNARQVEAAAMQARLDYPSCYLRHRARVFRYTMGANPGKVFYLTDPGVFPGEAGTEVIPNGLTVRAMDYIQDYGASWLARSVFFVILVLAAMLVASLGSSRSRLVKSLLPIAGALTYLAGSFFLLPAADARYNFWVNLALISTFCCLLPPFPAKRLRTPA